VSKRGQGSDLLQGRSLQDPQHAAGAGAGNTDPHHSGTVHLRKGGPLWLRVQAYVQPVTLCQDHLRVSTTGVLVTTRTGFPLQLRSVISTAGDVLTAGAGASSGTNFED
jgi:hypothetical protein